MRRPSMSQLSPAARTTADTEESTSASALFKDDRPRRIDRVIDYFGNTETTPVGDPCGETLFEEVGSDDE
jgi:hypothetical protein